MLVFLFFLQLYCCPEYEHFIKLQLTLEEDDGVEEAELIDISPHAPYGVKQNRKVATERIADR